MRCAGVTGDGGGKAGVFRYVRVDRDGRQAGKQAGKQMAVTVYLPL